MTPSTTKRGSGFPITVLLPRNWICVPPPGAPEFWLIIAPGTRPARARSRAGDGTRETSSPLTLVVAMAALRRHRDDQDRKSTRLNSSHLVISYAVFCLKKKKKKKNET